MYTLYVIELRKKVFTENRRFREANPQFNGVLECLYVGMTSKTAYERFDEHINGTLCTSDPACTSSYLPTALKPPPWLQKKPWPLNCAGSVMRFGSIDYLLPVDWVLIAILAHSID